ncbi:MAG: glycosyltransferase family 4 protein [Prevotella sp.]|nr:glycosyltransferase family 4 protein [Prevotella sp.]
MNIAYIIPSLKPMGPINVVYDLVRLMLDHGHECDVYYFDDFEIDNYFPCPATRISLSTKIDFSHYDIVHSHGLRPNIYVFRHKPFHAKGTKFISTFHNYVFEDFVMKYGKLKGYLGGLAFLLTAVRHDKIIALSKDAQRYYQKWYGKKKVSYIYNTRIIDANAPLTLDEKEELESFKGDGMLIGMNGSILYRKGVDIILRAMQNLPRRFKLFMVGEGDDMEKMKELANSLQLSDRVYFAGSKPNAYRYLSHYDIFALPSRSEGFPLALLEAACMGCKVVCSNLPILRETFSDEEVVMFQLPDEKALASSILKAVDNPALGSNVQDKFYAQYAPEHFYKGHIKMYSQS